MDFFAEMNKFSQGALNSVVFAQYYLKRSGDNSKVGLKDVLVGLLYQMRIDEDSLTKEHFFVNYEDAIAHYDTPDILGNVSGISDIDIEEASQLELSKEATEIMSDAMETAGRYGGSETGIYHVMLSLLESANDDIRSVYLANDVDIHAVIQKLRSIIKRQHASEKVNTKHLDKYCINMSLDTYDPAFGRETELERIYEILARRRKNNPVLIGEPGVGKTAIVEDLATKIKTGEAPSFLLGKRMYSLNLASLMAGTKERGEMEERMTNVLSEAESLGDVILFIDEVHTLVGSGSSRDSTMGIADMFKPALARGQLTVIGATTTDEYSKIFETDKALKRRFQPVVCEVPSKEATLSILFGIRSIYEMYHSCLIPDSVLHRIVDRAERYLPYRNFPDKAIDTIDELGSRISMRSGTRGIMNESLELMAKSFRIMDEHSKREDYQKAGKEYLKYKSIRSRIENSEIHEDRVATTDDVDEVISGWSGVPKGEDFDVKNLEILLKENIIGQKAAVEAISSAMRRNEMRIRDPNRPLGAFLFAGPTGVGKSHLAKVLSDIYFQKPIVQFDMSEYMESHSVSRLLGSPPGYVGYDDQGEFTKLIRRNPYCTILFDEVEKAHPDVFNVLLQVLEDGHATDAHGKRIDFTNSIIIMTSNLGFSGTKGSIGFDIGSIKDVEATAHIEAVKEFFRPEFLNRLDSIIPFASLSYDTLDVIFDILVNDIRSRFPEGLKLIITETLRRHIILETMKAPYGARGMRRALTEYVENPVAEHILHIGTDIQGQFTLDFTDGQLRVFM